MKRRHYLSKREREHVASEYCRNRLYKHLRPLAQRIDEHAEYFSLSPEDLFYHVVHTLDTLWGEMDDAELYCSGLWHELRGHFAENIDCGEPDLRLAATLVVSTTANLLLLDSRGSYWGEREALTSSTKEAAYELRETVEAIIEDTLFREEVATDLKIWLMEYKSDETCLSDVLSDKIQALREMTHLTGIENQEEVVEQLKPFFLGNKDWAEDFLMKIHAKDDPFVIEEIESRLKMKPMKMRIIHKSSLWKILHDNDLYHASSVNFSTMLKNRGY